MDFCYQHLGGNLVSVGSAFDYANLGCTHHCYDDWALINSLPGTEIIYPATPIEFDVLFRQTYRNENLTLFRLPETQHGFVFKENELQFGKGIKITEGVHLTIIVTGPHLQDALETREGLIGLGWEPEIIYIHTIKPLDIELIRNSASKTQHVLVMEEHVRNGGLGDSVLRAIHDLGNIQFSWIGIPDVFIRDYASYQQHCEALGLSREGLIRNVQMLMARR